MNTRAIAAVAAVIVLLQSYAHAATIESSARGWIDNVAVEFYAIDTSLPGGTFSFVNSNQQLRGLTGVDVGQPCVADSTCFTGRQQSNYTQLPNLPVVSDSLADGTGKAFGTVDYWVDNQGGLVPRVEAGCELYALGRGCNGNAGVSTTAADTFLNFLLGPNTRVTMSADTYVEIALRNFCLVTCNSAFARAELLADFGGNGFQRARNTLSVDAQFLGLPHDGSLVTDFRGQQLSVQLENRSNQAIQGRLRWLMTGIAATAVPEPGTFALLGLGLAGLGLSRRRKA